jgi:hypothetical protein
MKQNNVILIDDNHGYLKFAKTQEIKGCVLKLK